MKNKFRLFLVGLGLLVFPFYVNAENYKMEGSTNENVATYEIKYVKDYDNPDTSSVTFQIERQTDNSDNLIYTIEKGTTVTGRCVNSDLSCTVNSIEGPIEDGTVLATLTITNNLTENMLASFKVSGYESTVTYVEIYGKTLVTQRPKSNDASLSKIDLSIGTFDQTFNKDINVYNITGIKDTINKVRVTPNCDNNCSWQLMCPNGECSISDLNYVNLAQGANQVSILVTSEDGTQNKTYVLKIYRGDIELNSPYLEKIVIKNATISPQFDKKQNDYTAVVGLDVNQLDLEILSEDPSANVLIKGNENFKLGENIVTITVTSTDGQNKQVYTITVTKEEIKDDEEDKDEEQEDKNIQKIEKKKNNKVLIIILSIVGLALIIGVYFIIFKIKKNKKDKNKKDDDNNNSSNNNSDIKEEQEILVEKTTKEKIDEITKEIIIPNLDDEPKQDVDEALEDLMKTKQLELGDLDF